MKKEKPRKYCIICNKPICRSSHATSHKTRRGKYALTCSKKCSRIYTRISQHVGSKYRAEIRRLETKIRKLKIIKIIEKK